MESKGSRVKSRSFLFNKPTTKGECKMEALVKDISIVSQWNPSKYIIAVKEAGDYRPNNQILFKFPNEYGASVIQGEHSYGGNRGLFEIAVIKFTGEDWNITYDTPITEDVIGYLESNEVVEILKQIFDL
jgi:hypothetical protein